VEPTTVEATAVSAAVEATTVTTAVSAATVPAVRTSSRRGQHGKAERSARGDGQKGRFTNHNALL
jgi:hypothetical protein